MIIMWIVIPDILKETMVLANSGFDDPPGYSIGGPRPMDDMDDLILQ